MQQHFYMQAPDDTWEASEVQYREEVRKRIEAKEAKRLQQEAEELAAMSLDDIGNYSRSCWSASSLPFANPWSVLTLRHWQCTPNVVLHNKDFDVNFFIACSRHFNVGNTVVIWRAANATFARKSTVVCNLSKAYQHVLLSFDETSGATAVRPV